MLTSKHTNLKPLLESKEGVHLTAYLVNQGDLIDLKSQLRATIDEANGWLHEVMSADEKRKFLEPLNSILNDARIFKQMKGNIGLFRNEGSFRVLNIPIDVQQICQVATSFHVKPLLRWLQGDREFLFLGLEADSAHLYLGSQDTLKEVDSITFHQFLNPSEEGTFTWINEWISEITKNFKPQLFIAGEPWFVQRLHRRLKYKNTVRSPAHIDFHSSKAMETCEKIRKILKDEGNQSLEKALLEFRFAEDGNRAQKNIFQISKAVVQGRVKKLIVTDELSIFGRIDQKSGGLAIHPCDLDHEDDCILDDLAQMVLSQGGEVIVAKRDEIPKGRPILAILDDEGDFFEKTNGIQYEDLQERIL